MASNTQKKSTKKKSTGAKKSSSSSASKSGSRSRKAEPQKRPIRREVGGAVLLVLALCVLVTYFGIHAILIDWIAVLLKGLVGYGYWMAAPAMLLCGLILLFHRGKPVALRVTCGGLLPVFTGALFHLFLCKEDLGSSLAILPKLWGSGAELASGGAVAGLLAEGFSRTLSQVVSIILFIVLLVVLAMAALHITPQMLLEKHRNRPVYEEMPDPEPRPVHREPERPAPKSGRAQFDIPLDGEEPVPAPQPQKREGRFTGFFRHKSADMRTPDQVLSEIPVERRTAAIPEVREPLVQRPQEPEPIPAPPSVALAVERTPMSPIEPMTPPSAFQRRTPEPVVTEYQPEPAPAPVIRPAAVSAPAPIPVAAPATAAPRPAMSVPVSVVSASPSVIQRAENAAPQAETAPIPSARAEKARTAQEVAAQTAAVAAEIEEKMAGEEDAYQYPPADLLNVNRNDNRMEAGAELRNNSRRLADTLTSFGVDATPSDVVHGPSVTRYEFVLGEGVKLSKITNLADDIALALGATGVRIAPIPDKISVVGIEVPNKQVTPVLIRDVIESRDFSEHKSNVAFALGRDIAGRNVIGNIEKLPHVLIAGTTGSGKSVCTNSLIISLLYKSTPDQVRFIMVDPKMVELAPYNGIPHLLIPVVTDPKKAAGALQWAVFEMMKRYKTFSECGVKKLEEYNKLARATEGMETLPSVVVVIDELADLMLVAAKEVEESICRVAQMGRAAGVHLVIATQRPSSDVITGLMKANIPSRIAFAVASSLESRIILDTTGAEKLVGKGDMLYAPLGVGKPARVQGCFISPEEIDRVVAFVKQSGEAQYSEEVIAKIEESVQEKDKGSKGGASAAQASDADEGDELLPAAVDVVLETGQASVSMLQRRLKLGYSRAARLVDQMEERGIVGPFEGSKPRQLLITRAQWDEMQMGGPAPAAQDEGDTTL